MLMEFQSGPDAPLKPVKFIAVQVAPLDSYVSFNVAGAKEAFTSWSLEITDEKGTRTLQLNDGQLESVSRIDVSGGIRFNF